MNDREKHAAENCERIADTPRDEMKKKLAEMEINEYEETEATRPSRESPQLKRPHDYEHCDVPECTWCNL